MKKLCMNMVVIAGLTACGPLAEGRPTTNLVNRVASFTNLGPNDSGAAAVAAPVPELNRAAIEAAPANLLRLSLISTETTDVLVEAGRNGSKVTWLNNGGFGFTFDGGLLVSSRKTGDDLMGADVSGAKLSLENGGNHARTLDFLDSLDQIYQIVVQCETTVTGADTITLFERSYDTQVIEETCSGDGVEFNNTYWRDGQGVIWQSRQWISPQLGYLGYQRL